jgi:hypothetical protein
MGNRGFVFKFVTPCSSSLHPCIHTYTNTHMIRVGQIMKTTDTVTATHKHTHTHTHTHTP